nr:hypothetical protein [Escherichia coli]
MRRREGKQTEAENALTEANKDGAINQTEHDDLTGKNQAVTEAKTRPRLRWTRCRMVRRRASCRTDWMRLTASPCRP